MDTKYQQRVLTKPPTITKFFTPSSKQKDSAKLSTDIKKDNETPGRPLKRTSSGGCQSAKKRPRKQENIFQMFTTSSQTVKKEKKMTCPVCKTDVSNLDNTKMNLHIDTCVIEWKPIFSWLVWSVRLTHLF